MKKPGRADARPGNGPPGEVLAKDRFAWTNYFNPLFDGNPNKSGRR